MRISEQPLLLDRYGLYRDRSGIGQGCFGVTGQRAAHEQSVNFARNFGYPVRDGQGGDRGGGVEKKTPYQSGHDRSRLVARVAPYPVL